MIALILEQVVTNGTGSLKNLYVNAADPEAPGSTMALINRGNIRSRPLIAPCSHIQLNVWRIFSPPGISPALEPTQNMQECSHTLVLHPDKTTSEHPRLLRWPSNGHSSLILPLLSHITNRTRKGS